MNIINPNLRINGELQYGNYPTKIILHHPEFNGSAEQLNESMINSKFTMCGYNFYVRKDGTVYSMRPVEAIGANCYGENATSIGVAFEGNFMVDTMTEVQFNAGVELCKYLIKKYPAVTEIGPHKRYFDTDCPGINFPVDNMLSCVFDGTTTSSSINNNLIKLWDSGESVKSIQQKLIQLGYRLGEWADDGIFGQSTYNAVERFQASRGLTIDGVVGDATLEALNNAVNSIPVADNTIITLQHKLNVLLNVNLSEDGITGECTKAAVEQFQGIMGLVQDGIVGANTNGAMQEVLNKPLCARSDQGYSVRYIQYRVNSNIDGIFGWGTMSAVQNFQSSNGLDPDGIVGNNTWKALGL